jgi:hypothetical protein
MKLAEMARGLEEEGEYKCALELYRRAIQKWTVELAPFGADGKRELDWPAIWEGSCMTLQNVIARVGPFFMMAVMVGLGAGILVAASMDPDNQVALLAQLVAEHHFSIGYLAVVPL